MKVNLDNVKWNWRIYHVNIDRVKEGLENVINSATWALGAEFIDSDKQHYFVEYSSTTLLPDHSPDNFMVFEKVRKPQVVQWIQEVEGESMVNSIKQTLVDKLNEQCNNNVDVAI